MRKNKFASLMHALLAIAFASQALFSPAAVAQDRRDAPKQGEQAPKAVGDYKVENGTLYISYSGPIVKGMADFLAQTFMKYRDTTHRVVLVLASPGGSIDSGEQAIHVLRAIRQTHRLDTVVLNGKMCASMCIPVYLQGKVRFAAPSSLWVFHEAATNLNEEGTKIAIDREETFRILNRYYVPAGVSVAWLKLMVTKVNGTDYWQTGSELINAQTGIITNALDNVTARPGAPPSEPKAG